MLAQGRRVPRALPFLSQAQEVPAGAGDRMRRAPWRTERRTAARLHSRNIYHCGLLVLSSFLFPEVPTISNNVSKLQRPQKRSGGKMKWRNESLGPSRWGGRGQERGPRRAKAPEAGWGGPGGGRAESKERTQRELCPQRGEAQGTPEPSSAHMHYPLRNCFYRNKTGDGGSVPRGRGAESNAADHHQGQVSTAGHLRG